MPLNRFLLYSLVTLSLATGFARAELFTTFHPQINVAGTFNDFETLVPNMEIIGDDFWQAYILMNNETNVRFKFATPFFADDDWGDNDPFGTLLPLFGVGESRGADIDISDTMDGTFRFRFDALTRDYSVVDVSGFSTTNSIWINEIHYDNAGADTNEGVEIAGNAGNDLSAYKLVLYNGSSGAVLKQETLSGIIPNETNGYGALWFPISSIQNGAPDGIALVRGEATVVQFLSYEGTMTAVGGAADGMLSTDIGVAESSTGTPIGHSLQLQGAGAEYLDFTWANPSPSSIGLINVGQTMLGPQYPGDVLTGDLAVSPAFPEANDPVHVTMTAIATNSASNVTVTAYYRTSSQTNFTGIPMSTVDGTNYITTSPIPGQPGGTAVEYLAYILFDGIGTNSPIYVPSTAPTANRLYGISRVPVDQIWINEINVVSDFSTPDTNEFIELVAWAGTDMSDWTLELMTPASNTYASYQAPPLSIFQNETNGFGFFLFADSGVPNTDVVLNQNASGDSHIPTDGGLRLLDEFGVPRFEWSYGFSPPAALEGYDYIGYEDFDFFTDHALILTGTGNTPNAFTWDTNTVLTSGEMNPGQLLEDGNTNPIQPGISCPPDLVVECLSEVPDAHPTNVLAAGFCGDLSVTVTLINNTTNMGTGTPESPLVITRTYQAVSDCSTTATCTRVITVEDTTAPTVTCSFVELENAGFEEGDLSNWDTFGDTGSNLTANPGSGRNGSFRGTMQATSPTPGRHGFEQMLPALPGEAWTANAFFLNASAAPLSTTAVAYVELQYLNAATGVIASVRSQDVTDTDVADVYLRRSTNAVAPAGTAFARIQLVLDHSAQDGSTVYVDDTTLTPYAQFTSQGSGCSVPLNDLSIAAAIATDNCGTPTISHQPAAGTLVGPGSHIVTLSANDGGPITNTCFITATVLDDEPPVLTCAGNLNVGVSDSCDAFMPDMSQVVPANDACTSLEDLTFVQDVAIGTPLPIGSTVAVEVTVIDLEGNDSICNLMVTAVDTSPPSILCPPGLFFADVLDVPPADTNLVAAGDNCGAPLVSHVGDTDNGGSGASGDPLIIMRTYQAVDASANTNSCVQVITVDSGPIALCPPDIVVQCGSGATNSSVTGVATGLDRCSLPPDLTITESDTVVQVPVGLQTLAVEEPGFEGIAALAPNNEPNAATSPWYTAGTESDDDSVIVRSSAATATNRPPPGYTGDNALRLGYKSDAVSLFQDPTNTINELSTYSVSLRAATYDTPPLPWINEFHYTNRPTNRWGVAIGEFEGIEIAGAAGTDLSAYALYLYDGSDGTVYATHPLSGIIDDEGDCYGALWFWISGIQNGDPDGIALVKDGTTVLQFLSYEGSFTAVGGPADGLVFEDVGFSEDQDTDHNLSIQVRSGVNHSDVDPFTWGQTSVSRGALNRGQNIINGCLVDDFQIAFHSNGEQLDIQNFTTSKRGWQTITATIDPFVLAGLEGQPLQIEVAKNASSSAFVWIDDVNVTSEVMPCTFQIITRTWTVFDQCGASNSCEQLIYVSDTIPPVLTIPQSVIIDCAASIDPADLGGPATAVDSCDESPLVTFSDSADTGAGCLEQGVITRTWTATDACGNSTSLDQTITLIDTSPPVIVCPADLSLPCGEGPTNTVLANATADFQNAPEGQTSQDIGISGTTAGFWDYLVSNRSNPYDAAANLTLLPHSGGAIAYTANGVSMRKQSPGLFTNVGGSGNHTVVRWTSDLSAAVKVSGSVRSIDSAAEDGFLYVSGCSDPLWSESVPGGQTRSFTQFVVVHPGDSISATIGPGVTGEGNERAFFVDFEIEQIGDAITATDNCDDSLCLTFTNDESGGIITRTFTATDDCGNSDTCVQTITRGDVPLLDCPPDVAVPCGGSTDPGVTGTATVISNCPPAGCSGIEIGPGATQDLNNFTSLDGNGPRLNVEEGSAITLAAGTYDVDEFAFKATLGGSVIPCLAILTGTDTYQTIWVGAPVSTTVDGVDSETYTGESFTLATATTVYPGIYHDGPSKVYFGGGGPTDHDNSAPVLPTSAGQTLNGFCCPNLGRSHAFRIDLSSESDAVDVTYSDAATPGDCSTITRTWTATDSCGVSSSCDQLITVDDTTPPTITCPADITIACGGALPALVPCTGRVVRVNNPNAGGSDHLHLRELEVWSGGGNVALAGTASHSSNFGSFTPARAIDGNLATFNHTGNGTPGGEWLEVDLGSAFGIDEIVLYNRSDCCQSRLNNYTVEILDAPGGNVLWSDGPNPTPVGDVATFEDPVCIPLPPSSDDCDPSPAVTMTETVTDLAVYRTFTSTDACGNSTSCVQTITFEVDTTDPVITCPPDVTVGCHDSTAAGDTGIPTVTDNCSLAIGPLDGFCGAGLYPFTADGLSVTGFVDEENGETWLLVGRGREGWVFDPGAANGSIHDVSQDVGTPAAFAPAAYTEAMINDLLAQSGITMADVEIRIRRAGDAAGSTYQEARWRGLTGTWSWDLDANPYGTSIEYEVVSGPDSPFTDADNETRDTLDSGANNAFQRIFTWAWGNHGSQAGFSYGASVTDGANNGTSFLWENTTENHAIPYTEVYIRRTTPGGLTCSDSVAGGDDCPMITRTWTATDASGNSSQCIQLIEVQDSVAPVITCPVDLTIECGESTNAAHTGWASATDDDCTGTTLLDLNGHTAVVDGYLEGNSSTWAAGNVFDHNQGSRWTGERNPPDTSSSDWIYVDLEAIYQVDRLDINWHPANASSYALYVYAGATPPDPDTDLVSWTKLGDVTGRGGLANIFDFDESWDLTAGTVSFSNGSGTPSGLAPASGRWLLLHGLPGNGDFFSVREIDVYASNLSITHTDNVSTAGCTVITRTWTATDACGNVGTCDQIITFEPDTTDPVITCPADITLECGESTAPSITGLASATDNCDGKFLGPGDVVYQGDFTGTTLASAGLVASAGAAGGSWTLNTTDDRVDGTGGGNARSNLATIDSWQSDDGFTLDVTFQNTAAMTRFSFGLVDANYTISGSGDWLNSDLTGAYGIGFSTAGSESSDFLGFNSDAGNRTVLSMAQGDATVSGSTLNTMSITVTATGWSYSLNGAAPTTGLFADSGLPLFDLSRDYVFTAHAQRNSNARFTNITLTPLTLIGGSITIEHEDVVTPGACPTITRTWTATDPCGNQASCDQTITLIDTNAVPLPDVDIVELEFLDLAGSQIAVSSLGTNTWDIVLEWNTNLVEEPQTWTPIGMISNTYVNGTNTTTFPNPLPGEPFMSFRVWQEEP